MCGETVAVTAVLDPFGGIERFDDERVEALILEHMHEAHRARLWLWLTTGWRWSITWPRKPWVDA